MKATRILLWAAALLIHSVVRADQPPQFYSFHGQLLSSDGTTPLTGTVGLQLGIYSQNGVCLLYEEYQPGIDLTNTQGNFAIEVGSAVGDSKRTGNDQHLTMTTVFSNAGVQILAP